MIKSQKHKYNTTRQPKNKEKTAEKNLDSII